MKCSSTTVRASLLALVALAGILGAAHAQDAYPARPIQVIVPYAAGSGSDVIARLLLDKMSGPLGQRFIIDNRPAAGGNVGTLNASKAEPDGYTLLFSAAGPLAANKTLVKNLGYDPETDFSPVSLVAKLPTVFAMTGKLPLQSVGEFIAHAKAQPSKLNYGSPGIGSGTHLAGAYFASAAGIDMTHVPYKVLPQLVTDMINGEVALGFLVLSNVMAPMQTGQIKVLAVTSKERLPALPDTPTMEQAGVKDYEATVWFALLGPKGMPRPIVDRLNKEVRAALADPAIQKRFTELGALPAATTPEELGAFISSEVAKWRGVIERAGIAPQP
jgi:tripartite-type tricarboxylate transporter receptor subunit TctC